MVSMLYKGVPSWPPYRLGTWGGMCPQLTSLRQVVGSETPWLSIFHVKSMGNHIFMSNLSLDFGIKMYIFLSKSYFHVKFELGFLNQNLYFPVKIIFSCQNWKSRFSVRTSQNSVKTCFLRFCIFRVWGHIPCRIIFLCQIGLSNLGFD